MKILKRHFAIFLLLLSSAATSYAQEVPTSEGVILSRKLSELKLQMDSILDFPVDSAYTMSKYFERPFMNGTIKGWLVIAKVKIVSFKGNSLSVRIEEEKSEILVNDEKVDHFKTGNRIKLEPFVPEEPEAGEE